MIDEPTGTAEILRLSGGAESGTLGAGASFRSHHQCSQKYVVLPDASVQLDHFAFELLDRLPMTIQPLDGLFHQVGQILDECFEQVQA